MARLLPVALKALNTSPAPVGITVSLSNLVQQLCLAGYSNEAKPIYDKLIAISKDPSAALMDRFSPARLAALMADMGDLDGALQVANDAGPMTGKPSDTQVLMVASMMFDGAKSPPTPDQAKAAMDRAKAAFPAQVAGPKAQALSAIVVAMAAHGDIAGAQKAEAPLEDGPRDVLGAVRDGALAAIANAQISAGELHDAFATARRISGDRIRWDCLLKLAAIPPNG